MRQSSLHKVRDVLDGAAGPLTLAALRAETELSANTISLALSELGAKRLGEFSPVKWIKGESKIPALGKTDGSQVLVELRLRENWPALWEQRGQAIGNAVAALQIGVNADPVKLASDFTEIASSLASVALAIQSVQNDPDWYQKLVH
jgi:hypothetical protein